VAINRRHISDTGGDFFPPENLQYPNGLKWVLGFLKHPLVYGENPYPTVGHKAGLLAWTIIVDHCFYDGNKRTAMSLMVALIDQNNYVFTTTSQELVQMAHAVYKYRTSGMNKLVFCELIGERSVPVV
jgi:prophage maintenance system killer protein